MKRVARRMSVVLVLVLAGCASQAGVEPEAGAAALEKARASLSIAAPSEREAGRSLVLVHYMPWFQAPPLSPNFGWHWHMGSSDPYEVNAGSGLRKIASHYYPLTGPYDSADPALIEYQLLLMKLSGIDGVIVDWYGVSKALDYAPLHAAAEKLFAAVAKAGLTFAICYEDQSIGNRVKAGDIAEEQVADALRKDLAWAEAFWFGEKAYWKKEGRPVVLDFGPIYVRDPRTWTAVLDGMDPRPLLVTLDGAGSGAAEAAFSWPPMSASTRGVLNPDALVTYLNGFHAITRSQRYVVSTAFPGFHDYYGQANVRQSYGYLDDYLGATLELTLDAALRARSTAIQIATWNDFGEGTMIEPTLQRGYRDLETLQAMRRRLDPSFPFSREDLRVPLQLWARGLPGMPLPPMPPVSTRFPMRSFQGTCRPIRISCGPRGSSRPGRARSSRRWSGPSSVPRRRPLPRSPIPSRLPPTWRRAPGCARTITSTNSPRRKRLMEMYARTGKARRTLTRTRSPSTSAHRTISRPCA